MNSIAPIKIKCKLKPISCGTCTYCSNTIYTDAKKYAGCTHRFCSACIENKGPAKRIMYHFASEDDDDCSFCSRLAWTYYHIDNVPQKYRCNSEMYFNNTKYSNKKIYPD